MSTLLLCTYITSIATVVFYLTMLHCCFTSLDESGWIHTWFIYNSEKILCSVHLCHKNLAWSYHTLWSELLLSCHMGRLSLHSIWTNFWQSHVDSLGHATCKTILLLISMLYAYLLALWLILVFALMIHMNVWFAVNFGSVLALQLMLFTPTLTKWWHVCNRYQIYYISF